MSILKKLFGKEESPSQDTVVDSQVEVKAEVKKKEQKPEVVDGDQPLVGK
jgi:hypothetical protein